MTRSTLTPGLERLRLALLVTLAPIYFLVGVVHIRHPDFFMKIMPFWVPRAHDVIVATGICELFGAVGLLIPRTRWWAGVLLALYAVCVFPANIKHALDHAAFGTPPGWWYHGPRLLAQPLIMWWALFVGRVTDWPFARASSRSLSRSA